MRKRVMSVAVIVLMAAIIPQSHADGIPVIDMASIARLVLQYEKQVEQYKAQLDQLNAITGSRGMGAIANNPAIRQALPANFYNVYRDISSMGRNGASAGARAIYDAVKKYGCDKQYAAGTDALLACEAKAMQAATNVETSTQALQASQARVGQLQELLANVDTTTDAKAAADANAAKAAADAKAVLTRTFKRVPWLNTKSSLLFMTQRLEAIAVTGLQLL